MLLSQPLISAFQLHSGERNTVNVQGWILKFKKSHSFLFPLWLISFRISGERSCFCASGLFLVASSAAAWRCRRRRFSTLMKVTAAFVSGSLRSVMLFIYLCARFSSLFLPFCAVNLSFGEVAGRNDFLIKWPRSTCVYRLLSLLKYWSSFVLGFIESEDRLVAWKGVASLCLLICQTSIQHSELTQMWCKRSRQTNGQRGPEILSGAGVCLIDMIGIGKGWLN